MKSGRTEPMAYQHFKAPQDTNGNPRRCFVVYGSEGNIITVEDEGYASRPGWLYELPELPNVKCSVREYQELLKLTALSE